MGNTIIHRMKTMPLHHAVTTGDQALVSVFDLVSNVDEESFESSVKLTTVLNHSPGFYSLFLKCQIPKYHLDHVR